jgi:Na+-transporting NADH:ubiquinone oxidoreductase subunit B
MSQMSLAQRLHQKQLQRLLPSTDGNVNWNLVNQKLVIGVVLLLLFGCWNTGRQIINALAVESTIRSMGWQMTLLSEFNISAQDAGIVNYFFCGLVFTLPLLIVSFIATKFIYRCFQHQHQHQHLNNNNSEHLLVSMLYVALLPATIPLAMAALGISFGLVFAKIVFGGHARYFVNPALLAVVFLNYSYPTYFENSEAYLAYFATAETWQQLANGLIPSNFDDYSYWFQLFLGVESGSLGSSSDLLALLFLGVLMIVRWVDWSIPVGAILGLLICGLIFSNPSSEAVWKIPWWWHLVVGHFTFALTFILSDPAIKPITRAGGLMFGLLFGLLTVLIRSADPSHPEASLLACLLVCLLLPLLDRISLFCNKFLPVTHFRVNR